MVTEQVEGRMAGTAVLDRAKTPVGEVCLVFLDAETEQPRWASVQLPGAGPEVVVPLDDAAWDQEGLRLAFPESSVRSAPRQRGLEAPDSGEEQRLYFHYGIPSVRLPRDAAALRDVDGSPVSYSVREPAHLAA